MEEPEPEVLVTTSDEVPKDHLAAIHSAVTVMAMRSRDATRLAFERNRAPNMLARRIAAPLKAIVEADVDAAAALSATQDFGATSNSVPRPRIPSLPRIKFLTANPGSLPDAFAAPQVFGAPWGYQWQWHNGQPPVVSSQDRVTGEISLGAKVDQSTNRSDAHGGFGVSMTTDQARSVVGRSLRRTTHFCETWGGEFGGSATAEGGMEMTALDGTTLLNAVQDKRFRIRSSSGEYHNDIQDQGAVTGDPIEMDWVMVPGHVFTFNVGCWVYVEAHGGAATGSFAGAHVNGLLIAMTAAFAD